MILTCPDCATRYFIDETKLGQKGRKVRCAGCGASWRAEPDAGGLAPPSPEASQPPGADPACDGEGSESGDAIGSMADRPAEALPKSFRARAEARRRARHAMTAGVVWAGLAASFAVLTLCAVVFRVQVVHLLPRAAGAYATLRLPVNPLGLSPEGVQAAPGLQDGHTMLFVHGVERNVDAAPRPPADLRVSLYDKAGQRVASLVAPVAGEPLPPGETRDFRAAFVDPPLSGTQVGVDLVFPARGSARASGASVPVPRLRGPAPAPTLRLQPVEVAQPLPASSPYALPSAARAQAAASPD